MSPRPRLLVTGEVTSKRRGPRAARGALDPEWAAAIDFAAWCEEWAARAATVN